jgi:hypothetical protein
MTDPDRPPCPEPADADLTCAEAALLFVSGRTGRPLRASSIIRYVEFGVAARSRPGRIYLGAVACPGGGWRTSLSAVRAFQNAVTQDRFSARDQEAIGT